MCKHFDYFGIISWAENGYSWKKPNKCLFRVHGWQLLLRIYVIELLFCCDFQAEIVKRLNAICAQVIPFLSQEVGSHLYCFWSQRLHHRIYYKSGTLCWDCFLMNLLVLIDDFSPCCYHFIVIIFFRPIKISFKYIYETECVVTPKQNFSLNIFL